MIDDQNFSEMSRMMPDPMSRSGGRNGLGDITARNGDRNGLGDIETRAPRGVRAQGRRGGVAIPNIRARGKLRGPGSRRSHRRGMRGKH
jgi:hypothetical protein